jgi:hypothetical protein
MLIRKIGRDRKADVVIAKCGVLPESEILQPISELLHSGSPPIVALHSPGFCQTTLSHCRPEVQLPRTQLGGRPMAYVAAFGAYEASEQRERAMAAFEQLTAGVDMSPGQRALAIDLMLAFARAEIMRPGVKSQ